MTVPTTATALELHNGLELRNVLQGLLLVLQDLDRVLKQALASLCELQFLAPQ